MRSRFIPACALVSALLLTAGAGPASAQSFESASVARFEEPVTLANVTLPAGEYAFTIVNPSTGGDVVQVFDTKHREPVAMVFARPAGVEVPVNQVGAVIAEGVKESPAAIRAWVSPDDVGREFPYLSRSENGHHAAAMGKETPTGPEATGGLEPDCT